LRKTVESRFNRTTEEPFAHFEAAFEHPATIAGPEKLFFMPIHTYQDVMLPVLEALAKVEVTGVRDLAMVVADQIGLTPEEKEQLLPSGKQSSIVNRVGWACWYLMQAGLVHRPKRAHFAITQEGKALLGTKPATVDIKLLESYPSFVERVLKKGGSGKEGPVIIEETNPTETRTPRERVESAIAELTATLVSDLRDQLGKTDPYRFEQMVLDLLVAMGYGGSRKEAAEVTQKSGDEGIDGVINEDRLGLDVIYIQAKRWKTNVGRPEIQNFVGALAGKKASKGIFITTSDFHGNAREYAAGLHQKIILIDGKRLAALMIDNNIGVTEEEVYRVKRVDSDYFLEDAI
jgi:restriction system protein